jgi:hypothetical protein
VRRVLLGRTSRVVLTGLLVLPAGAGLGLLVASASGQGAAEPQFHGSGPLIFEFVKVGQTSEPKSETISNVGTGELEIADVEVPDQKDFSIETDECVGVSLSSGQSCTLSVVFHPGAAGTRFSSLVFSEPHGSCKSYVAVAGSGTSETKAPAVARTAGCSLSTPTTSIQTVTAPGQTGTVESTLTPGTASTPEGDVLQFVTPPRCVIPGRHIRLDLHTSKADQIVAARVYINGHLDKAIRDPSISAVIVDLPHNNRLRRYRVQAIANIAPGGTLGLTRYFSVCPAPRKHGSKSH